MCNATLIIRFAIHISFHFLELNSVSRIMGFLSESLLKIETHSPPLNPPAMYVYALPLLSFSSLVFPLSLTLSFSTPSYLHVTCTVSCMWVQIRWNSRIAAKSMSEGDVKRRSCNFLPRPQFVPQIIFV